MDISDGFDYQQSQPEHQQASTSLQANQNTMHQQNYNDMQCDSMQYPTTSTFGAQAAAVTLAANNGIISDSSMNSEQQPQHQMSTNIAVPVIGCMNAPASPQQTYISTQQQQQQHQQQLETKSPDVDIDIDSLLLQQFSCLGTTDHEDLIKQFRTLLNHETTKDSAKFFLEMSNWNLQAAIGCYLDYSNGQQLPTMKVVLEARPSEGQQAWRIRNEGTESWPPGCYIISPGQDKKVEVPALRSGECCDIIADIPRTHPTMCIWRLCTPYGTFFGDAIIMVGWNNNSQLELSDRMSQLSATVDNSATTYPNSGALEVKVVKVNME